MAGRGGTTLPYEEKNVRERGDHGRPFRFTPGGSGRGPCSAYPAAVHWGVTAGVVLDLGEGGDGAALGRPENLDYWG